jgi:hypothetical protein
MLCIHFRNFIFKIDNSSLKIRRDYRNFLSVSSSLTFIPECDCCVQILKLIFQCFVWNYQLYSIYKKASKSYYTPVEHLEAVTEWRRQKSCSMPTSPRRMSFITSMPDVEPCHKIRWECFFFHSQHYRPSQLAVPRQAISPRASYESLCVCHCVWDLAGGEPTFNEGYNICPGCVTTTAINRN